MSALPAAAARRAEAASTMIREAAARTAPGNGTPPSAATTPPAAATPPAGDEQARLKSDLERANAEVARLNSALTQHGRERSRERSELEQRVTKAEARVKELDEHAKRRYDAGDITSLTDEERRLLGEDAVRATSKIAREAVETALDQRVKPLIERLDQFERMNEAQYFATLDDLVPDWERVNNEPKFMSWLNDIDPASNRTRLDLIKTAAGAWQGYRVADIFRAFKEGREIGARQPPSNSSLEHRIEPGPGGGNPPPVEEVTGRIWTRAQIATFYREKREGKWKSKEKEARETELDINAAYREGRIRG